MLGEREPQEVGLRRDDGRGRDRRCASKTRARSAITSSTRARISSCAASDAERRDLRERVHLERHAHLAQRADHALGARSRTRRAARRARTPSRTCAARATFVVAARASSRPSGKSGAVTNSRYASSNTTSRSVGHAVEEALDRVAVDGRARRVVRVAHEHQPGAVGDRRRPSRRGRSGARGERHLHHRRADLHGEDRVRLERRPTEHHLVTRVARGGERHAAELDRTVAEQHLLGLDAVVLAPAARAARRRRRRDSG